MFDKVSKDKEKDKERIKNIIKELMDYGEFEDYFQTLWEMSRKAAVDGLSISDLPYDILLESLRTFEDPFSILERKYPNLSFDEKQRVIKRIEELQEELLYYYKRLKQHRVAGCRCSDLKEKGGDIWIGIDADGTIFDVATFPFVGRLIEGSREGINYLRRKGYKIMIWSSRNSCYNTPVMRRVAMGLLKIALDLHQIDYDLLDMGECGKTVCDYYIDDRAIRFTGWQDIINFFKGV